jgi:F-type H+-transporting ATPase subunit b
MVKCNLKAQSFLKFTVLVSAVLLPAIAIASGDGGHADSGVLLKDFLYRCFNFALLVGLLVYFITKPVRKALKSRTVEIEKVLAEAQAARVAAEAKHREYSEKLAKATEEIANITESIRRDGVVEREKIVLAAKELAVQIEKETDNKAAGVVDKARIELREEATRLAVELAEDILKKQISADDQKRLVNEYMSKVGELH